jgi:hypothetical protein
MHQQGPASR